MIDLSDYIAHLVDGRSTGVLATNAQTYSQVLGLATALKATVQWFRLDAGSRPKFIVEAERYLAEQPIGAAIVGTKAVEPNENPMSIRSGPVVARKGGRGVAGRQEAVVRVKDAISQLLSKVSTSELHAHQVAFEDPSAPKPAQGWVLAWGIADALIFEIPLGFLAEELQRRGFTWSTWDDRRRSAGKAAFDVLEEADLSEKPVATRAKRLEAIAEQLVRRMLSALGVAPDKDLFRQRRRRG
jgi:hypothetical protein